MNKMKEKYDDNRIRNVYLHYFLQYYNNKMDIDEYCLKLRKLDKLFNVDSEYYKNK